MLITTLIPGEIDRVPTSRAVPQYPGSHHKIIGFNLLPINLVPSELTRLLFRPVKPENDRILQEIHVMFLPKTCYQPSDRPAAGIHEK
jgi:hypothetical protein